MSDFISNLVRIASKHPEARRTILNGILTANVNVVAASMPSIRKWVDEYSTDDYPSGRSRVKATWKVERKGKKARISRVTEHPRTGRPSKPKTTTYAQDVKIGIGNDGKAYIAHLHDFNYISLTDGTLKNAQNFWADKNPPKELLRAFDLVLMAKPGTRDKYLVPKHLVNAVKRRHEFVIDGEEDDAGSQVPVPQLPPARSPLAVGKGFYDRAKKISYHRYMSSLKVQDMTNAGKRGKKVETIAVYDLDYVSDENWVNSAITDIVNAPDFASAKRTSEKLVSGYSLGGPSPKYQVTEDRGVDVVNPETRKLVINTSQVRIEATPKTFSIVDKEDTNNLPAAIPPSSRKATAVRKFYAWALENETLLNSLRYSEILREMSKNGIEYHSYLRMD